MSLAWSKVRNSWQLGGACLLMRSKSDLQSVVIIDWALAGSLKSASCTVVGGCDDRVSSSCGGIAAKAGGSCSSVSSAFCHRHFQSRIQAQYSLIHARVSTAPASDMASADNVLTTTFWIFFECQTRGFTGLVWLVLIWPAITSMPWCESGTLGDANEASENAMNRVSSNGIGWNLMGTSACILASWRILFPSIKVPTTALLIWDWSHPGREHKSGRVFTAAYWREPMRALAFFFTHRFKGLSFSISWDLNGMDILHILFLIYPNGLVTFLRDFQTSESEHPAFSTSKWILFLQQSQLLVEFWGSCAQSIIYVNSKHPLRPVILPMQNKTAWVERLGWILDQEDFGEVLATKGRVHLHGHRLLSIVGLFLRVSSSFSFASLPVVPCPEVWDSSRFLWGRPFWCQNYWYPSLSWLHAEGSCFRFSTIIGPLLVWFSGPICCGWFFINIFPCENPSTSERLFFWDFISQNFGNCFRRQPALHLFHLRIFKQFSFCRTEIGYFYFTTLMFCCGNKECHFMRSWFLFPVVNILLVDIYFQLETMFLLKVVYHFIIQIQAIFVGTIRNRHFHWIGSLRNVSCGCTYRALGWNGLGIWFFIGLFMWAWRRSIFQWSIPGHRWRHRVAGRARINFWHSGIGSCGRVFIRWGLCGMPDSDSWCSGWPLDLPPVGARWFPAYRSPWRLWRPPVLRPDPTPSIRLRLGSDDPPALTGLLCGALGVLGFYLLDALLVGPDEPISLWTLPETADRSWLCRRKSSLWTGPRVLSRGSSTPLRLGPPVSATCETPAVSGSLTCPPWETVRCWTSGVGDTLLRIDWSGCKDELGWTFLSGVWTWDGTSCISWVCPGVIVDVLSPLSTWAWTWGSTDGNTDGSLAGFWHVSGRQVNLTALELCTCCSPSGLFHNWHMSIRKKLLLYWWIRSSFFGVLLQRVPCSVSMMALIPLRKELDNKNGVFPGTIAMRNLRFPSGSRSACLLVRVCWLPNRNVRWQLVLCTCFRMSSGRLSMRSFTWCSPTTVWDAPRSTIPMAPVVAKCASSAAWATMGCCLVSGCSRRDFSDDIIVLRVFLAKDPGPENKDLPLPFPRPFFPNPFSKRLDTGQKPRTFTRSLNLRLASWCVE